MKKAFTPTFRISETNSFQKKLHKSLFFLAFSMIGFSSLGQVTGTVFRDVNGNGTKQSTGENGVLGVTVKAFNSGGSQVGSTATTDAFGNYTIASVSGPLRIEFTNLPPGVYEGPNGTGSKTSVQFVTAPATNVSFGANCPEQHNTTLNPKLYIPCYVNGNPLGGGTAGTDIGFVSFNYADQSTGTTPGPDTPLLTTSKLGSVWAVAHSRQASKNFVAALLKRHMGMGPLGSGGIYLVDAAGAVTNWLDLDAIGIPTRGTGTYGATVSGQTVTFSSVIGTNTQRGLPANKVTPNNDAAAFDQVGKVSLGGMDLSFDGQYLYIVNLFDRKVYQIDITTPASPIAPTSANMATKVKSWAIPNPGCTNGTYRPWACKYYKGKVYIGVVCSGENGGGETDITQYVYTLDPATGFNTTPVLTIPNYNLRFINDPGTWASGKWQKWTNTMINGGATVGSATYWGATSPILSDIEFDTDGSMIVGILERGGHQGGLYNYPPSGSTFVITTSAGDVLRAYPNATMTSWTLENNGDKDGAGPYVSTTAQKNTSGPGGGEFYNEDKGGGVQGGPTPDNWHQEVSNGALAFVPGTDITAMVGMDALEFNSGGIFFLNNSTGKTDRRLGIFPSVDTTPMLFGKAIGLGDIDYAPEIPPIEIGNRVWNDVDKDGIQDPDETGIDGVIIDLYEGTTKVGTATSANGGQWYFNTTNVTGGLKPNTIYTVKVATALGSGALATYGAYSTKDASSSGQTDFADSDVNTLGEITLTTGNYGINNHTFDIGVTVASCSLSVLSTSTSACYRDSSDAPMVTVNFSIGWTSPTNDSISVTFNGVTKYITGVGTSGVNSRSMNFVVPAGYTGTATAQIVGNATCSVTSSSITTVNDCTPTPLPCSSDPSRIGGVAFQDYNEDGSKGSFEIGKEGIVVKVYDCDGNLAGTTTTDAAGNWSVSGLDFSSGKYRVEFSIPNTLSDYQPSANGSSNATDVQFVSAASCNVNFGINVPSNYCETVPQLVTVCYVNGLPAAGEHVLVTFPWTTVTTTGANSLADANETGSTWGISYAKKTKTIYTSTFLKRHTGILNDKLGMIYTQSWADTTQAPVAWLDVTTLGINLGQSSVPTNAARGLGSKTAPSKDAVVYDLIGKVGIGDIDISSDEKTLYFVNLFDQKLYAIDIASKTVKSGFPATIPNSCSAGTGTMRPFGLKYFDNKLFIGTVCDGQTSQKNSDLFANVYSFDGSTMTNVLNFPLNYLKGNPSTATAATNIGWFPWTSTWPTNTDTTIAQPTRGYSISYPQPILSDIEFDSNGDIILGFMDRFGHQSGAMNYQPGGSTKQFSAVAGGDILRAANVQGSFILESNGTAGNRTTAGATNNQGPGGGEYYFADAIGTATNGHQENVLGGLAINWALDRVAVSTMDPRAFLTGGILTMNNTTGARGASQTLYTTSYTTGSASATFGKAAGIGDVEAICTEAPKEIGNRVWIDTDGDGVQGACETALAGVNVSLYKPDGTLIASTTTNANGEYYFKDYPNTTTGAFDTLATGQKYYVVLGKNSQFNTTTNTLTDPNDATKAYELTTQNSTTNNGNDKNDSDANLASGINAAFNGFPVDSVTIGDAGYVNHTLDFGLKPAYGSIGDYVWTDINNNGQQDGTETPISGVKVYLLNASGVKLDSTLTDATGKYLFDSLLTGSYKVQFVAPAGTIAAKQNTGADVTDSDANNLGMSQLINIDTAKLPTDTLRNNPQIDAGFVPVGSLGDYVFNDKDGDGVQDATDTPIAGIKVYLLDATTGAKLDSTLTDALGKYTFDSLLAGSYKVQFVVPAGSEATGKTLGGDTTKDSNINPDGTTDAITINTTLPVGDVGRNNPTIDAGIKPAYGSIGDYVWTDTNNDGQQTGETPISGVKVYLLNASGVKLDSTTTDATGKYLFDSLLTGSYKVQFVAPAGTIAAKQNTGADVTDSDANKLGMSQLINIDTTKLPTDTLRNNPQIDAGFVPVGSLGDYVFNDKDGDGIQDATDTPIAGIKVYLLDATTGAKLDSALTDALGKYTFDSLLTGDYKVQFVIPAGSEASPKIAGTDTTKDSNINPDGITDTVSINTALPLGDGGRNNPTIDAGIKPAYGSIGDYVWTDQNNNGQQDGTEAPIAGVKVYLLDGTTGAKLDSALTDATGKYLFDSLLTGSYKVQFVAPVGTIAAKQNTGADVTDSDANKLGLSQLINIDTSKLTTDTLRNNPQIDAGFVPVGSIGDYVFEDLDKSNTQTSGDTPLAGVKVYLLDATTGVKLDSTTTDAAGLYLFDSLVAGNYKVQFVAPSGTLLVGKTSGTDVTKDSNPDPTTGITDAVTIDTTQPIGSPARDNRDVDAGIKLIPAYGSIGDYVWSDINNNGQQDGTEAPIAGVKVYLYDATGTSKLDSTLTDVSGKYLFDSLLTGAYKVKFVAPAGSFPSNQNTGADVTDSDANDLGWSQVVNIDATKAETDTLRNNPQIDAGFVPFGSIGDYVFDDKDNSNTQTAGDLPVEGVKVYLLDATTGAKLDSTVTNAAGLYKFDSLIAGNYKVQVVVPTGMLVVTKDSGADDTKDSDIDNTGTTGSITVDVTKPIGDPLRDITSVDAGIKGNPQYGSIGDYVWFDNNDNGQQDGTELPIASVKVYLYDAAGTTKLDSTLTDASGKYLFDSLLTGGYKVKFESPAGTFPAKQNTGADVTDSDANALGWSQVVNIDVTKLATDTLRNNPQIDAGFVPFGSLGDYVFEDKDNSNTQTAGDLPISGVKVYLLDATTGAKLDSTLTDGVGKYLFDSLVAGNYKVQFVAPSGSLLVTKISGTDVTKDSNPDPTTGITDAVTIDTTQPIGSPARDNRDVDAGVKAAPQFGSIGDYVWTDTNNNGQQDGTESPIAGVKVYLYDATGTTKLDSALTDASGKYLFDSLITAAYKVQFVAPAGTIAAKQNTGADVSDSDANSLGWSQIINIDASLADTDTLRNNPQIDAGFVPVGSIGDYVFIDKDNSNTQTAGDLPMEGVKVYLLDATTGAKLDSTLTDAAGLYKFDSLVAGNYKVQVTVPTGMTTVNQDSGADDAKDSDIDNTGKTGTVTVDTTKPIGDPLRDITNVDAGLKGVPQYGSLGDYVWFDNNNNGQQDGTESPIQGVKVYLYDAAGTTKLDSALTDATGKYLFDSLLTGAYKVQFVAPTGTLPAKQNTGADVSDSDANATGWSQVVNIDVTKLATDTLRNNPQIDSGFVPFGSIGDFVFQDKDNSNTQTVADTPIPCIVVYLLDATTGAKLDSTMTDISGKYLFDSLLAGNYKIQFVAPIGGTFVTPLSGGDVIKDSNPDATGLTATVTIDPTQPIGSPARDNRDVDAGLKIVGPFGSIGDYVWSDVNNNGQQDGTEAPIAGVKVYLYDGTGTTIMDSTVTDATGKYLFDSLFTADYKVKFVAPAGTIASKQNTGADVTDSDANNAGWSQVISIDVTKLATDTLRNNPQIDAGFVPVGSIGDYVFEDKDNSNTQTAGDAPIQGVKVYLLDATTGAKLDSTITDGAGKYLFDSLIAGNYKVQFVAPSGTDLVTKTSGTDVTKDSNPDPMTGITDAVTIDTTQPIGSPVRDNRDVDAGIKASLAYGSLGDYVWMDTDNDGQQDAAEAPIAGVKVYLYDASGTTKLDSTLTDAAGKYLFDSLLTGSYKVKFVAPVGTIAAKQNTGADVSDSDANKLGWSQVVNIDVTLAETDTLRNNPQIDAGFIPVGSIGDYVFNDKDNSNTQTTGDLPIEGVKVYLLDATTGAKLDSTVTDSNGLYKFDSLLAGNYKVQVVAPTGMTVVTKDSGADDTKDSDIDPTGTTGTVTVDTTKPIGDPLRDITNVDAGLKGNPAYGSIGNFVWTDQNNNGQQDGTETPIEGVKIYLYDGTGTVLLDSTLTNAAGNYLFDSLLTGSYKVQFVAPVGTIPAKQNTGSDVSDSDANKLGWSQVVNIDVTKLATDTLRNNPQIDAGFVPVGSIGDYVFNDKDDSKTQTAGDLPIGGVKVYLLDATTGAKLDSTITDGAGKYLFDSLVAGNYKVQFVAPVGTNLVTKTSGTDVTKDSNPDPTTGITDAVTIDTTKPIGDPARDNRDVDAGLKGQPQYGSLGDYVWMDTDNDGQQDATESPIAGVKVYLYDAAGLVKIDSALTDATGKYLFDSLLTGGYKVQFVAPVGTIAAKQNTGADVTDSDANKAGWSQVVNIDVTLSSTDTLRNNPQIDAGFVPVGSIGDYVFVDNDNSNTQTVGDTPVAGIKVYLLDAITGAKLDSTVTNINGLYKFDSLLAGNYKVQFVAPTGASLVTKDSGADDTKDSDADSTGTTGIVTVDTTKPVGDIARDITSVDAGLSFKVDLRLTKVAVGDCKRKVGDVVAFKIMVKRQDLIITDVTTTIKDSLSANFEFVSASATEGTYSNTTGIWSGITLAQGDSAVLTVNARIRQGVAGLACNDAWIQTMDKGDFDSIAGNKIESEDDFARACVSVPLPVCTARGEKAELTAPAGYTNYQWLKNGQVITGATSNTYLATTFGEYTVTVNNGSCPSTGCCPIYVEEFCDCPPTICVPYVIQKTKSKK